MPRPSIHPGVILADELAEIGIAPAELARQLALPIDSVGDVIGGRRRLDGNTALRLAHGFGNSAQFWLNLQTAYDIRIAEDAAGAEIARLPIRPTADDRPSAA